ncbi:hypothetical protein [Desulfosediminicola flagellatus]|uniref:hypothetical protein n=1 Tax=Desulfosediminicola flagellatus TaxID=2569541 RepID=UPI0010AD855E|nr:hypothetical protein [Desulfosediminicola flagellatus]
MNNYFRGGMWGVGFLVAVQLILGTGIRTASAVEVLNDSKKHSATTDIEAPQEDKTFKPSSPKETSSTTTSTPNKALIIGGAVALGIGAIAIAGGGGGGGSDSSISSSSTVGCELDPVGADIAGTDWQGKLRLLQYGSQMVVATIEQCGRDITIRTVTAFPYGKVFVGSINGSGHLDVTDQNTFQIWTTFKGRVSSKQVRIYDYVNGGKDLDYLELSR